MGVPIQYRKSSESLIASYNYTDVAEGTGIIIFYGFANTETTNVSYNLSTSQVYSNPPSTSHTENPRTMNFDTAPFNLPKIVKGTAFINLGCSVVSGGSTYVKVQLQRFDGTTGYNISNEVTSATIGSGSAPLLIKLPLTQTGIKKGEVIRLIVKHYAGSGTSQLWHDPRQNTTIAGSITALLAYIPFAVDV